MQSTKRYVIALVLLISVSFTAVGLFKYGHQAASSVTARPATEIMASTEELYSTNMAAMNAAKVCDRIHVTYPSSTKKAWDWKKIDNGVVSTRKILESASSSTFVDGIGFQNHLGEVGESESVFGGIDIPKTARQLADEGGTISFTPIIHCYVDRQGSVNVTW